jgi:mRNA interferase MazF
MPMGKRRVRRFEVYLVALDPTRGAEIRKTRPAVVVSPDEMNNNIQTIIIAPMTTVERSYPTRVACEFEGKEGQVVLDQIRTVDKSRLVKRLGTLDESTCAEVLQILQEMFAP